MTDLVLRVPHVRVLRADELRDGELIPVEIDGTPVVLVRHAGEFFAVQNNCSHKDFPLSEAGFDPRDGVLVCAWHGGCFDVRTGDAVVPPATEPVETFAVRVIDGWVEIALTGSLARDRRSGLRTDGAVGAPVRELDLLGGLSPPEPCWSSG